MSSLKQTVQFDPSNLSAFGTLETNELTPVIQLDFIYGINTQTGVSTVANSATVDTNASRLRLQSGTNSAGSAIFNSRRIAKYRTGQGMTARFTCAFTTGVASSTQIVGVGNSVDGVFFGYNGTTFGLLHRNNSVDTWVARTAWNGDKADGTGASQFNWDPTKGNVCMVKYPFLGYGDIEFFVQDSNTGRFILVHVIKYANSSASVEFTNPSFFFYAQALNAGNTTNLTVYVGSAAIFISGVRSYTAPKWSMDSTKTAVTTETNIISIRNATTYNTVTNRALIRLNSISLSGTGGNNSIDTFRLKIGATVGGTPAFTAINGTTADNGVTITNGNAVASYDTAGTTVTGGTYFFSASVANGTNTTIDLSPYDLFIAPGETMTLSGQATVSSSLSACVTWAADL